MTSYIYSIVKYLLTCLHLLLLLLCARTMQIESYGRMLSRVVGKGASKPSGNGWLQFAALNAATLGDNGSSSSGGANTSITTDICSSLYGGSVAVQTSKVGQGTNSFEIAEAIGASAVAAARTQCGRADCKGTLVYEASNVRATKAAAGLHGGAPLQSILLQKTGGRKSGSYISGCNVHDADDDENSLGTGRVLQSGRARGVPHVSMSTKERARREREAAKWEVIGGILVRNSTAQHTPGVHDDDDDDSDDDDDDNHLDAQYANESAAHVVRDNHEAIETASGDTSSSVEAAATASESVPLEVRTVAAKLQRKRAAIASSAEICRKSLTVNIFKCCECTGVVLKVDFLPLMRIKYYTLT